MRRSVVVLLVLAVSAAAGAGAYTTYADDREYEALIAAGDQAVLGRQPLQALEAYSDAIALRPDSMVAHLKRGVTYRERGDQDAAASDLREAARLDPTATLPLELLGDTYVSLDRFDRAADRFEAFVALDDRSARVWYKLGLARYRGGHLALARTALTQSVSLEPSMAEAHLLLGLCQRDLGQGPQARTSLETATALAPALTEPREALASLYAAAGDMGRAIDQLAALAALDADRPDRFVALGLAHLRARRNEAAVLTLTRAVERFPTAPGVYAALGRVWLETAQSRDDADALNKAIEALSTAASHADASGDALSDLGHAWLLAGNTTAAERVLIQAVSRLPVAPHAHRTLAGLAARAGRIQDARDGLIRYATLVGDTASLESTATEIASYSLRLGEPAVALHWIARAVDDAGNTATLTAMRRRAEAMAARQP
jgi:tetratricopeptide (TPR) repeat protein